LSNAMTTEVTSQQQEERNDRTPEQASSFWQVQLALAEKDHQTYFQDGQAVVDRYKNERARATKKDNSKSFNILFSNVETLKAALYGRAAKPDVRRRFGDKDPTARLAAEVVERGLLYCAETYDVDRPLEAGLHDHLLPGRGVVRVVYEPIIGQQPKIDPMTMMPAVDEAGQPVVEEFIQDQDLHLEYVYWKDYLQSPSRMWSGVWWIAFRHVMSREELRKNGFEDAETVPLNWAPTVGDGKKDPPEHLKKAEVWEVCTSRRRKSGRFGTSSAASVCGSSRATSRHCALIPTRMGSRTSSRWLSRLWLWPIQRHAFPRLSSTSTATKRMTWTRLRLASVG
jgi:hypothetical protein